MKFFNPKRVKIIIGIIIIIMFGVFLDFVKPYQKGQHELDLDYYTKQIEVIGKAVDEHYLANGSFPKTLFGGDKRGFEISGKFVIDPLIEKGYLEEYPEIKHDSIRFKRNFTKYKMDNHKELVFFGVNGNKMSNIKWANPEIFGASGTDNIGLHLLAGNFIYELLDSRKGYVICLFNEIGLPRNAQGNLSSYLGYGEIHTINRNGEIEIKKIGR